LPTHTLHTADEYDFEADQPAREVAQPPRQVQAQYAADDVRTREKEADDLQDLERDILDLREIQHDIAVLVQDQGEDIDRIDQNVAVAQVRVEHGAKETAKVGGNDPGKNTPFPLLHPHALASSLPPKQNTHMHSHLPSPTNTIHTCSPLFSRRRIAS